MFIDGGTDHYGEGLVKQHIQLATLQPEWRDVLTHWDISLALLATDAPLAHELAREPGWRVRFCDPTAVLLERSDVADDPTRTFLGRADGLLPRERESGAIVTEAAYAVAATPSLERRGRRRRAIRCWPSPSGAGRESSGS